HCGSDGVEPGNFRSARISYRPKCDVCLQPPICDTIAIDDPPAWKSVTDPRCPAKSSTVREGDDELRALMIRYQGGSLDAFQEIYVQLAPGVRRYLRH